jgi:hypothetical protein
MDPLSDDVRNVLNGYNAEVISMFVSFAKRFIEQSDPSRFLTLLPTSKLNHFSTMDASLSPAGSVIGKLRDQAVPHTVRSCFSALSGQGDIFTSVQVRRLYSQHYGGLLTQSARYRTWSMVFATAFTWTTLPFPWPTRIARS